MSPSTGDTTQSFSERPDFAAGMKQSQKAVNMWNAKTWKESYMVIDKTQYEHLYAVFWVYYILKHIILTVKQLTLTYVTHEENKVQRSVAELHNCKMCRRE